MSWPVHVRVQSASCFSCSPATTHPLVPTYGRSVRDVFQLCISPEARTNLYPAVQRWVASVQALPNVAAALAVLRLSNGGVVRRS